MQRAVELFLWARARQPLQRRVVPKEAAHHCVEEAAALDRDVPRHARDRLKAWLVVERRVRGRR